MQTFRKLRDDSPHWKEDTPEIESFSVSFDCNSVMNWGVNALERWFVILAFGLKS